MFADVQQFATEMGVWAAILLATGVIWAKGVRPVLKVIRLLVHTADRLEASVPVLEEIAKEFKPNSGKTLADVVGRMDRNISTNARNNHVLYDLVASLPDANADMFPRLESLEEPPPVEDGE